MLPLSQRYSSQPKRPIRGGRRGTADKDSSEEEFLLRNLNFGDENTNQSLPNSADTNARPPARAESRPSFDTGRTVAEGPTSPLRGIRDRPMRGERRERPLIRQSFDLAGGRATTEQMGASKFEFGDQAIAFDREESRNSGRRSTGRLRNAFGGNADRPVSEERWERRRGSLGEEMGDRSMVFDEEEHGDLPVEDRVCRDSDRKMAGVALDRFGGISDRPMRRHQKEIPPNLHSFNRGGNRSTRDEMDGPKLDFSDDAITFEKEEKDTLPGQSLIHKLKFTDDADRREEEKDGRKSHNDSSPSDEHSLPESSVEDADVIFSKLKKNGLIPNAVAMLDGLCKDGLVQEAMKLFGLMREKGTIPEVVIYTAVVEGFCRAGRYDDAKRIFRKMQKNNIVPNAFSYGIIIQGLCKGRMWEDCTDFCLEMLDSGHSPNVVTFIGLVDGTCKDKGVEEAEKVLKNLRERGLAIDEMAVRDHMDKKGPFSPIVWEAIFGKKGFKTVL